jgi:hypothetical protein
MTRRRAGLDAGREGWGFTFVVVVLAGFADTAKVVTSKSVHKVKESVMSNRDFFSIIFDNRQPI